MLVLEDIFNFGWVFFFQGNKIYKVKQVDLSCFHLITFCKPHLFWEVAADGAKEASKTCYCFLFLTLWLFIPSKWHRFLTFLRLWHPLKDKNIFWPSSPFKEMPNLDVPNTILGNYKQSLTYLLVTLTLVAEMGRWETVLTPTFPV